MNSDFKIIFAGTVTGRGPTIIVEMPEEFNHKLPAQATIIVDGVETQNVEISFAGFFAYRSVEAYDQSRNKRSYLLSEPIDSNEGREWKLRIHD